MDRIYGRLKLFTMSPKPGDIVIAKTSLGLQIRTIDIKVGFSTWRMTDSSRSNEVYRLVAIDPKKGLINSAVSVKYGQWQACIDKYDLFTEPSIEFEVIVNGTVKYAKIIVKERRFTIGEMLNVYKLAYYNGKAGIQLSDSEIISKF